MSEDLIHDDSCESCGTAREAKLQAKGRRVEMLVNIRRDGYRKIGVFSEVEGESDFSYTVGLFHTYQRPELVIFGLSIANELAILDTVYDLVVGGMRFAHGDTSFEAPDGASIFSSNFQGPSTTNISGRQKTSIAQMISLS